MGRQVIILQNASGAVLGVQGNLKAIAENFSDEVLSYRQMQRLIKTAKEKGECEVSFKGKGEERAIYRVSWWEI